MTIAIYLAHLNPVTNAHSEIIKDLTKSDEVVVMPVRFLIDGNEVNSKSFPFTFELRKQMLESVFGDSITCLLYTSPSPRDPKTSRMPSSA